MSVDYLCSYIMFSVRESCNLSTCCLFENPVILRLFCVSAVVLLFVKILGMHLVAMVTTEVV